MGHPVSESNLDPHGARIQSSQALLQSRWQRKICRGVVCDPNKHISDFHIQNMKIILGIQCGLSWLSPTRLNIYRRFPNSHALRLFSLYIWYRPAFDSEYKAYSRHNYKISGNCYSIALSFAHGQ